MSLTLQDVQIYLAKQTTLSTIDNHQVVRNGNKAGQTFLAIEHATHCIDALINTLEHSGETMQLTNMQNTLLELPTPNSNFLSIASAFFKFNQIQQDVLNSIHSWLEQEHPESNERHALRKAMVLILKILEYDLSKTEGAITKRVGIGFFSTDITIMDNETRLENHAQVVILLNKVLLKEPGIGADNNSSHEKPPAKTAYK